MAFSADKKPLTFWVLFDFMVEEHCTRYFGSRLSGLSKFNCTPSGTGYSANRAFKSHDLVMQMTSNSLKPVHSGADRIVTPEIPPLV